MPVEIRNSATKSDIENAILSWLDLLAMEKYTDAFEFTLHTHQQSPERLQKTIASYGFPDEKLKSENYKVTNWNEALSDDTNNIITIYKTPKPSAKPTFKLIGEAYYDLPIDGVWSDLTAVFRILQTDRFTTLELSELRVM